MERIEVKLGANFKLDFSQFNMNIKLNKPFEDDFDFNEVLVQDFDDDYHKEKDPEMVLYNKAKGLLNQYSNYSLYEEAIETYEQYMETLYEKYGGKKYFKKMFKSGLIDEFIPTKPILRRTSTITNLIKYGVHNANFMSNLSKIQVQKLIEHVNELSTQDVINILNQSEDPYGITYNDLFVVDDRRFEQDADALKVALMKDEKKKNNISQTDALLGYFEPNKISEKTPSLTRICSTGFDIDEYNEKHNTSEEDKNKLVNINGRYVTNRDMEKYELRKYLLEGLGIDIEEDRKKKKCYKKAAKKAISSSAIRDYIKDKSFKKSVDKQAEECVMDAMKEISEALGKDYSSMDAYTSDLLADIADTQMDNVIKKY